MSRRIDSAPAVALHLSSTHLQAIQAHAQSTYPEECCGLMVGRVTAEGNVLASVVPVENVWAPGVDDGFPELASKRKRYWIAPEVMLAEMRQAREQDLAIVGIYHSHPDHPAIPSECDRQYAWPQYSYLIVSVHQGQAVDYQSWNLDDHDQFQPEPILAVDLTSLPSPC